MTKAKLTESEGNSLLYLDFSGLSHPHEFELVIAEADTLRLGIKKARKKHILLIADFTDSIFTPEVYDILARYSRMATTLADKHAIVGLKPASLIRAILRTYAGKEVHSFNTKKAALDWLLKEKVRNSK